ncbi:type IV secretion system protein [Arcobacter defluvii]|uniref:P-type type IV conjugative transfer system protein TrbJ/VirB5 n=1 Tax=Arcobacter defluvii TaxID=873191 RepID=A0AAE7E6F9_9BACT|nr:type IV secretion system protein [Arcobacter defluvii]QKF77301.1 P-type type IV conjugative transfer system protein TrbJ/VirB5 [Arcobacter defluvii]QKF77855.1 P-type type IV conjugative transfer system protein TrbJ/VirB5 [Arcobacter defluvii]RXI29647.1 hypothetical protein CP964_13450 [Arcobacter defluvii]
MKKYLLSAILSTQLLFSAGIPVIDGVANAQAMAQNIKTIAEWAKEAERWANTVTHYQDQLKAYEDELLSKTGIRDTVSFVQDLNRLQSYAKIYGNDYLDLGAALANKNSMVGNQARQLFDKYNVFDRCSSSINKEACENKLEREVTTIATVQQTKTLVDKSAQNLENLSKKVSNTEDIKESQDIANAINIEIAQLQVVQMKMDMLDKQNNAVDKSEQEQTERYFASKVGVKPKY